MEKYKYDNETSDENNNCKFGKFFNVVYNKQVAEYGETGANNIVENVIEIYNKTQQQMNNPALNSNVLMVGKVQSGKTSNLELLTAIAFDNGYNIMVIYGGYDNSLLSQTTDRFKKTFNVEDEISYDSDSPAVFTTSEKEKILGISDEIMGELLENEVPIIFVSMKRPQALQKVNNLFERLESKEMLNAFIIDDEGDQASLNNAKDKKNKASATYREIKRMKEALNDPLYLSVTATPQANIFLNDLSVLRPDSIYRVQPGKDYQGVEQYHLNDNDIISFVDDSDIDELSEGRIPESLWNALRHFIVASAIKRKRASSNKEKYSDMIVHSFREVNNHSNLYVSIYNYIRNMKTSFEYGDENVDNYFEELHIVYNDYINEEVKSTFPFEEIMEEIKTVIKKTHIILKNGQGKVTQENESLKWHKIYIGGDLLQRGLTFKNLITTYFTRWANSGGNMDVNLQRARWLGYRKKYIDLCKIFTTENIAKEFGVLAEVEDDLWSQFADIENGLMSINDILIEAENTSQIPTNKSRVKFNRIAFKKPWIKQKYIVDDPTQVKANNKLIEDLISSNVWSEMTEGSNVGKTTGLSSCFSANQLKEVIELIQTVFDCDPFQKKTLIELLDGDNLPVVLMWDSEDNKNRIRSMYPNTNQIKVLQQGPDKSSPEEMTYLGDTKVVADKGKINIQIHYIVPRYKGSSPIDELGQYMFAIYLPKEKVYFAKDETYV